MSYSIVNDTANARVNLIDLQAEINASSISPTLDSISTEGDLIVFDFGAPLNAGDEVVLGAVLAAHNGDIPSEAVVDPVIRISSEPAFADKIMVDGKKLYGRVEGREFPLVIGVNYLDFDIPYAACKITGIELINGSVGDKIDLFVLDDDVGTYSTIPNYPLNQFGFSVNVAKDLYQRESRYDADLYYNMTVSVVYYSQDAKSVYINYSLHEVK